MFQKGHVGLLKRADSPHDCEHPIKKHSSLTCTGPTALFNERTEKVYVCMHVSVLSSMEVKITIEKICLSFRNKLDIINYMPLKS